MTQKEKIQQNKLKHHKIITSNIELAEKNQFNSEMKNARQELLKDVMASITHVQKCNTNILAIL